MSTRPTQRPAITLTKLAEKKALGEPIAMVTAYDYPSAQVAEEAGVDVVLVGDSGAMTVLGYPSTVPVTLDELLMLASAVRRGLSTPLLVGDMPFGSYEESPQQAFRSAAQVLKETGCGAIKVEGGQRLAETVRFLVERGVPVMGHVGLTPQSINTIGGFKVRGRDEEGAAAVYIVNDDTAERTPVTAGLEKPDGVEILSGVTEGQTVLTSAVHGLGEKAKLVRP